MRGPAHNDGAPRLIPSVGGDIRLNNPVLILFALLAFGLFPVMVIAVFIYLRSSFRLLALLKEHGTLWEQLGRPEKVLVPGNDMAGYTIQPLFLWLTWVWSADPTGLSPRLREGLQSTSRLLKAGLVLFLLNAAAILVLVLSAS